MRGGDGMIEWIGTLVRLLLVALGSAAVQEPVALGALALAAAALAILAIATKPTAAGDARPAIRRRLRAERRERGAPAQCDPGAAGHPRPRAPGGAAPAA
ncbi:DUF6412 domain-containing protein [Microbacterium sp. JZ70]